MEKQHLILLLKNDDRDAFTELYNQYWKRVYNFCRLYLSNSQDAEEVVQEVFVKLWDLRHAINEDQSFDGFLFIITRNFIFNQHRRQVNEETYRKTVLDALNVYDNPEQELEANDLNAYIDQLINLMPPRRREIFVLSRYQNLSYKEIAAQLHIAEKTVEHQISEALRFLRSRVLFFFF